VKETNSNCSTYDVYQLRSVLQEANTLRVVELGTKPRDAFDVELVDVALKQALLDRPEVKFWKRSLAKLVQIWLSILS